MTSFDLSGKTTIITGSTSGIGLAIARCYAKAGASVVISSEDAGQCDRIAEQLRADGLKAFAIPCDVTDDAAQANLVA